MNDSPVKTTLKATQASVDAAAENAFTSEGGRPSPMWSQAAQQQMDEFSIRYDGRQYSYGGHLYDRLTDAIAYAELERSRSAQEGAARLATASTSPLRHRSEQLAAWTRNATSGWFHKDKT